MANAAVQLAQGHTYDLGIAAGQLLQQVRDVVRTTVRVAHLRPRDIIDGSVPLNDVRNGPPYVEIGPDLWFVTHAASIGVS
ncbi:hypothetical protein GCM10027290_18620 [Micromonospora sonneratiae]|uniref:Uncharacterized protein n=1 Tax=Micromonospora sonneratiae TaxID=1184706 RepID=A0ABW3YC30_9ACTN